MVHIAFPINVASELAECGYSFIEGSRIKLCQRATSAFHELMTHCHVLPPDPQSQVSTRERVYGRFVFHPWSGLLDASPPAPYLQSDSINPEVGGVPRHFAQLQPEHRGNVFLRAMIRADFSALGLTKSELDRPWEVGVHIVKMVATTGRPGTSSPNCLHKDGEPFTCVHLLSRVMVNGGENLIADNTKSVIRRVLLEKPMDTLIVRDEAVYHSVMPIEVPPGIALGSRMAALIDFTPLVTRPNIY